MYQHVNRIAFIDAFNALRPENFTRDALLALFEHIEELELAGHKQQCLDVIELCGDYSELTLEELRNDYGYMFEDSDGYTLRDWRKALKEKTTVISVYSGYEDVLSSLIIQTF